MSDPKRPRVDIKAPADRLRRRELTAAAEDSIRRLDTEYLDL